MQFVNAQGYALRALIGELRWTSQWTADFCGPNTMLPVVEHAAYADRFLTEVEGHRCTLDYELFERVLIIVTTRVPEPVSGRGVAACMTRAALGWAREQGYKVLPHCPYAARFIQSNPEYADLLNR